jgi:hypothetical protein
MVTIVFPLFSGRFASSIAAHTFAPEEMPARIPSSFASRRAIAKASSFVTWMHSVICACPPSSFRCRLFGTNPAPVPWILCGPGLTGCPASVCEITGESFGSDRHRLERRFPRLDHLHASR